MNTAFIRQVGVAKWALRYGYLLTRKYILGADSHVHLPTGIRMTLQRYSQSATEVFVTNASIDWGAEELLAGFADRSRDFLDIGAHIGYYSLYLSQLIRRA